MCVGGAPCCACPRTSAKALAACCTWQPSTGLGRSLLTDIYVMSLGAVTVFSYLLGMMSMMPLRKYSLGTSDYYLSSPPKMCL